MLPTRQAVLLRADIWVTNDLGKCSFLDATVWFVWARAGDGVRKEETETTQIAVSLGKHRLFRRPKPGKRQIFAKIRSAVSSRFQKMVLPEDLVQASGPRVRVLNAIFSRHPA